MYWYDTYWSCWVRRLLKLSSCVIDVTLTGEWEEVRQARLRVHNTADDKGVVFHDHLPADVVARMESHLGVDAAWRLVQHNFIRELGVRNIVAANLRWTEGGGVPVDFVRHCNSTAA